MVECLTLDQGVAGSQSLTGGSDSVLEQGTLSSA